MNIIHIGKLTPARCRDESFPKQPSAFKMSSPLSLASLKKLTVPQLKALCKEQHITGYSKLPKDAIIQKLLDHQNLGTTCDAISGAVPPITNGKPTNIASTSPCGKPLDTSANNPSIAAKKAPPVISETATIPSNHSDADRLLASPPSFQAVAHDTLAQISVSEGPAVHFTDADSDGRGISAATSKRPLILCEPPLPSKKAKNASPRISVDPIFKVPDIPRKPSNTVIAVVAPQSLALTSFVERNTSVSAARVSGKRFKPLLLKNQQSEVVKAASTRTLETGQLEPKGPTSSSDSVINHLDFPRPKSIKLYPVSLPPSVSQRRRVPTLSLALCAISKGDLKLCAQVSRLFRYSAYMAAKHQLLLYFPGRRLDALIKQHPASMTNFWPYLHSREEEVLARKTAYGASFLGKALKEATITDRLWSSPDHDKQIVIAIRFLMTRFFFFVSIGQEDSRDSPDIWGIIIDVQEAILNEIWTITIRSSSSTSVFYVLESTCEVIGLPQIPEESIRTSFAPTRHSSSLRVDWSAYISQRLENSAEPPKTLLEHLQWTNHEEYDRGISKLWLSRIRNEGQLGISKEVVARRYTFACIVSNSVSGSWLTLTEMAQEFNDMPSQHPRQQKHQKINLFLPAHHHVESVHFTTSAGKALHPALAVVQTPGREYYILKDNGMQVGCEEDGVAPVWMSLLGCNSLGGV